MKIGNHTPCQKEAKQPIAHSAEDSKFVHTTLQINSNAKLRACKGAVFTELCTMQVGLSPKGCFQDQ